MAPFTRSRPFFWNTPRREIRARPPAANSPRFDASRPRPERLEPQVKALAGASGPATAKPPGPPSAGASRASGGLPTRKREARTGTSRTSQTFPPPRPISRAAAGSWTSAFVRRGRESHRRPDRPSRRGARRTTQRTATRESASRTGTRARRFHTARLCRGRAPHHHPRVDRRWYPSLHPGVVVELHSEWRGSPGAGASPTPATSAAPSARPTASPPETGRPPARRGPDVPTTAAHEPVRVGPEGSRGPAAAASRRCSRRPSRRRRPRADGRPGGVRCNPPLPGCTKRSSSRKLSSTLAWCCRDLTVLGEPWIRLTSHCPQRSSDGPDSPASTAGTVRRPGRDRRLPIRRRTAGPSAGGLLTDHRAGRAAASSASVRAASATARPVHHPCPRVPHNFRTFPGCSRLLHCPQLPAGLRPLLTPGPARSCRSRPDHYP